jgi:hypothetical protein
MLGQALQSYKQIRMPRHIGTTTGSPRPGHWGIAQRSESAWPSNRTHRNIMIRFLQSLTLLSLSALVITDTELRLIAALAIIGLSSRPHIGYRTPPAIGIPSVL